MSYEHNLALAALTLIALAGAYLDVRFRRLPNLLCIVAFVCGIGVSFATNGAGGALMAALHAILALALGMFLYSRGWLGGGDAKFYAGLAAWFPISLAWLFATNVSVSGLLLLLVWYALRRKPASDAAAKPLAAHHQVPYGVAISAGALLTSAGIYGYF